MQTFAISAASSAKFGEKQGFGAGLMLHELKAETAPGNYADNDNTTSSSNGYVGVLHCTAFTSGSTTVKLQHGVTVGTYADLGTQFTALTATGSQVVYGTGTVNRFVRAITSAVSASTTFAVAFVRK
jgi:hypothetical protein